MRLHADVHDLLVKNGLTRKYQRRFSRFLKSSLGCPDAYGDMFELVESIKPQAILDIGCFVGDTILRFTDEVNIPIYGFEPTKEIFNEISNKFANSKQVRLFNLALSDVAGEKNFYCNRNKQTNSLLEKDIGMQESFPEYAKDTKIETIRSETLDNWMSQNLKNQNVFIKSDIQGAELMLINGGINTFKNFVDVFYSEAHIRSIYKDQASFVEIDNLLTGLGFVIYNIYPCLKDKRGIAIQTDVLWVKESLLV